MRTIPLGGSAVLEVVVTPELTVQFEELGSVHPVYATYNMAKHFEEAGRKLLLRHLDDGGRTVGRGGTVQVALPQHVLDRTLDPVAGRRPQGVPPVGPG